MSLIDNMNIRILLFIISVLIILVLQRIIHKLVQRAASDDRIPPDVVNGIRILIRFLAAMLILYSAVLLLEIGRSTTLSLSVFLGSIVSFASMHTIQNFVSGLYLLITRPFKVNDFVRIGCKIIAFRPSGVSPMSIALGRVSSSNSSFKVIKVSYSR